MQSYFPFQGDQFAMTMGVQPLGERPLIEIDPQHFAAERAEKQRLLAADHAYYFQALPGSEPAQQEAADLVLADLPASLRAQALASQPDVAPLDWAGRWVQEDLLIMASDAAAGFPLIAGQLCFANRWSLEEKLGQSFAHIHAPVPRFASALGRSSDLLMARLKPNRPVWRLNWSIKTNNWLDLSSRHAAADDATMRAVTAGNAGEHCWLRVERQGLARLPHSGAVLFTIHTYLTPIAEIAADPSQARTVLGVLRSAPPETLRYKGIAPFAEPLCAYLAAVAGAGERVVGG